VFTKRDVEPIWTGQQDPCTEQEFVELTSHDNGAVIDLHQKRIYFHKKTQVSEVKNDETISMPRVWSN
jgi:hypothetical protein